MSLNEGSLRSNIRPYCRSESVTRGNKRSWPPKWGLFVALAAWMMVGCGTPHATLQFTAPPKVLIGTPFTVTVTVLYEGKPDTVINAPIHFTSSDPAASLPGNYYFTPSDAGSRTFTNAFVLSASGTQTISGYIYFDPSMTKSGINGSAKITVSP